MSNFIVGNVDPAKWEEMPLATPPPGVVPNFTNREYNGHSVIITGILGLVLATVALLVRIYAKVFLFRKMSLDDYAYIISWLFGVTTICLFITMLTGGVYGYHEWDVQIKEVTKSILARSYFTIVLVGPFQWFARLALFSLILTAFAPLRYTKVLVWTGVVISGCIIWGASIYVMVQCRPSGNLSREAWLLAMTNPRCASSSGAVPVMDLVIGSAAVVTDFYIFMIPLPAVFQLRLPRRKKLGVFLVFSTALGACICSVVSLYYRTKHIKTQDVTYIMPPLFVICNVEITVCLLLPCVTSITKIYHTYKPQIFKSLPSMIHPLTPISNKSGAKKTRSPEELDLLESTVWDNIDSTKPGQVTIMFPAKPQAACQTAATAQ